MCGQAAEHDAVPCGWPKATSRSRRSAGGESSTLSAGTTMRSVGPLCSSTAWTRRATMASRPIGSTRLVRPTTARRWHLPSRGTPARHIAAWVLASSTDAPASGSPLGHRHHDVSIEMIFWLQQTEVESNELGWIPQGWGAAFWQAADRPRTLRDILASWAGLSISICRTAFTV